MRKISKYREMFNNCENIARMIKDHADEKNHIIYKDIIDVFVGDEETNKYFIDFEAKNKTGNYYRIRGNYTIEELQKMGVIKK